MEVIKVTEDEKSFKKEVYSYCRSLNSDLRHFFSELQTCPRVENSAYLFFPPLTSPPLFCLFSLPENMDVPFYIFHRNTI